MSMKHLENNSLKKYSAKCYLHLLSTLSTASAPWGGSPLPQVVEPWRQWTDNKHLPSVPHPLVMLWDLVPYLPIGLSTHG